jgi:hypothetical protein
MNEGEYFECKNLGSTIWVINLPPQLGPCLSFEGLEFLWFVKFPIYYYEVGSRSHTSLSQPPILHIMSCLILSIGLFLYDLEGP